MSSGAGRAHGPHPRLTSSCRVLRRRPTRRRPRPATGPPQPSKPASAPRAPRAHDCAATLMMHTRMCAGDFVRVFVRFLCIRPVCERVGRGFLGLGLFRVFRRIVLRRASRFPYVHGHASRAANLRRRSVEPRMVGRSSPRACARALRALRSGGCRATRGHPNLPPARIRTHTRLTTAWCACARRRAATPGRRDAARDAAVRRYFRTVNCFGTSEPIRTDGAT